MTQRDGSGPGSMTVYTADGGRSVYPQGARDAERVIEWFHAARDGDLIALVTETGMKTYYQRRHITRLEVRP